MKKLFCLIIAASFLGFAFAESSNTEEVPSVEPVDTSTSTNDGADYDGDVEDVAFEDVAFEEDAFDDFDSIFDDAQDVDEAVVKEEESATKVIVQTISGPIHVSGSLTADLGIAAVKNDTGFDPSGYLDLYNYFYIDVRPNNVFSLHTYIYTNIKSYAAALSFGCFYFDYLFLNNIFISAGAKGISWGNTRLFNSSTYHSGIHNSDIMLDSGNFIVCQIRYPFSSGTFTFIPMCPKSAIASGVIGYKTFQYAISYETVLWNTNMNLFGRLYSGSLNYCDPLLGLELKRTICGFDCYGQAIVRTNDIRKCTTAAGINYVVGTVGLYRLWDGFDPNIGFNIEYQVSREHASQTSGGWTHLVDFEGGIKRMGKAKNQKIGVELHHNVLAQSGLLELAYVISGIFPYANWSNGVKWNYAKDNMFQNVTMATTISLDLNY